jgi:hypothetical protein
MEISEDGIYLRNQITQETRSWGVFTKWKEDQKIIVLYHSDVMFTMLPKRLLTDECNKFVREQLEKNGIPEK